MDSIESAVAVLPNLREELENPEIFREIYKFSFDFYKEKRELKSLGNVGICKEILLSTLRP